MSKKLVELDEAKKILMSDKVFYNGGSKFNYVDIGKYKSGVTIEIPREWTIDKKRKPESPIKYIYDKRITDGMNIYFDGEAGFLLGEYRLSQNGRPVFKITNPTQAKDVMIEVSWGGSFNRTRGQYSDYAREVGATYFRRKSSNGGGTGYDYWILPVGFVYDMEPRDVSDILKDIEEKENKRIEAIDQYIEQDELEKKNSRENREIILEKIRPIIEDIKNIEKRFMYEADEDVFKYKKEGSMFGTYEERYTEELVNHLRYLLEKLKKEKENKEKYKPMYEDMETIVIALGLNIKYDENGIKLIMPNYDIAYYEYSHEGYLSFISELKRYQEKIKKEAEESRIKAEELKREAEWKKKMMMQKKKDIQKILNLKIDFLEQQVYHMHML